MPKPRPARHPIRRVTHAILSTPWAILPAKLQEICDFLSSRGEGVLLDRAEVQAQLRLARAQRAVDENAADRPRPAYHVTEDGIAVVPLMDVLAPRLNLLQEISGGTSTAQFAQKIRQAADNADVRAILVPVDSPGGSALGLEAAAEAVRYASGKKPIRAVVIGMMCSAAYYIGSAVDQIWAAEDSMVGSIGTVAVHLDTSRADAKAGRRYTVVAAGPYKWADHGYEPLSEKGRGVMDELVADYYRQFVTAVAANRGISFQEVLANYGQGKTLIGTKAQAAGLVDHLGSYEAALADLREMLAAAAVPSPHPLFSENIMDKRIVEQLVAMGLLAANATSETAEAVLSVWYTIRGRQRPAAIDQVLADLKAPPVAQTAAAPPPPPPPPPAAAVLAAAPPQFPPEQLQQATLAERNRIEQIRARGGLLAVEPAVVQTAIDSGHSIEQFLVQATAQLAQRQAPIQRIEPGPSAVDRFQAAAVDAIVLRSGVSRPNHQPAAGAAQIQHRPLLWLCEESLRVQSGRAPIGMPEDIARAALGDADAARRIMAGPDNTQGAAAFPNILGAAANRYLEAAPRYAGTTYQNWAWRRPSVPDFKPSTLVRYGEFGEFPLHVDGDEFEGSDIAEDFSWIQVESYGDEFGLTPKMIVDDDLGAFLEALLDKQNAHDQTLNRLCVNLLTGNVLCGDGLALFVGGHANIIALGHAPDTTELAALRLLLRNQTGVSAKRTLNYTVARVLVPPDLETVTQQLLAATLGIYPGTETAAPVFKGQVAWDVEPMLSAASTVVWYAFADPAIARSIVYCHQTGYETMQRRDYYNPKTNSRIFQFEGRFAAAVNNYRGVARTAGTGRA